MAGFVETGSDQLCLRKSDQPCRFRFAYGDCKLVNRVELGDYSVIVGEVIDAGVSNPPEGPADDAISLLNGLREKVFTADKYKWRPALYRAGHHVALRYLGQQSSTAAVQLLLPVESLLLH